jgi:hypothetical protein
VKKKRELKLHCPALPMRLTSSKITITISNAKVNN